MGIIKNAGHEVTATVGIGKDLVALLRDGFLMVLAALLIFWPHKFNDLLVNAGFEEGSLVGFKWKAGFAETRTKLEQANAELENLKQANAGLTRQLNEAKKYVNDDALQAQITSAEQSNQTTAARLAIVQSSVQATIAQCLSANMLIPVNQL